MEKVSLDEKSATLEHLKHIPKSKEIIEMLKQGLINESELRKQINLSFQEFSMSLSLLEIEGIIKITNNSVQLL